MNTLQKQMMERYHLEQKFNEVKDSEPRLYQFMNNYTNAWYDEINSIEWYKNFYERIIEQYETVAV